MSNYNTGNPVPSIDPRDLDDNATIFDRLLSEHVASILDRLGVPRKTWWQMEQDALALISPNVSALAGLTGAADRLPYFTGAGAMSITAITAQARALLDDGSFAAMLVTLGAAARGVNGDITSMTGLTTPLSVDQGGTGATTSTGTGSTVLSANPTFTGVPAAPTAALGTNTTQLATMAALQARILGTVSQSAGVPTGTIVERGSNANGEYVKFADGTMICTKSLTQASAAITNATGSLFYYSLASQTFAATFIAAPVVHSGAYASGAAIWATTGNVTTAATGTFLILSPISQTTTVTVHITAIGRWF